MKSNKVLLIVQTILMYVAHIPFYIALLLIKLVPDMSLDNVIIGLLLSGIILSAIILPFCIVNGIMAIISLFKDFESPIKLTLRLNLILIPWYIMNFIICILLSAGFLNPRTFLGLALINARFFFSVAGLTLERFLPLG